MRNASAMAMGISASASTTLARFSWTAACISCSLATAKAPALFGFGSGDPHVGFGLKGLQVGADVVADVDIGDIDRQDFIGRAGVEAFLEHSLRDRVGLFEDLEVGLGRADGVDDPFADPGDDGLVGGTADQSVEVGADGHLGFHLELNAVLGDPVDRLAARRRVRAGDDLGIDAGLDGLEHIAARQVDRRGSLVRKRDIGAVGGDQGRTTLGTLPPAR